MMAAEILHEVWPRMRADAAAIIAQCVERQVLGNAEGKLLPNVDPSVVYTVSLNRSFKHKFPEDDPRFRHLRAMAEGGEGKEFQRSHYDV